MPILPELSLAADDFAAFNAMRNGEFNENFTEEDLEAYKYIFSRPSSLDLQLHKTFRIF